MLKNLVLSAAAAGLAAGLFMAVLQEVTTTPLILEAERFEASAAPAARHVHAPGGASHVHGADAEPHSHDSWTPADGLQRTLSTSLSTIVMGIGFGLVLLAAMALAEVQITARTGLAFGVAGFAAAALAPALGLPPELPGGSGASLQARQLWWFFAAGATAAGLAALLLSGRLLLRIGGAVLVALPHIVGAPDTLHYASTAPAELAGRFAAASLVVGAVFWAVLGTLSGTIYARMARAG